MISDNHSVRGPLPKVFGIGLSKTGTSSLGEALNLLGIRTVHYPSDAHTYKQLTSGDLRLSILDHYQGIADTPVVPYYAQLDKLYPGSKFILTVRNRDGWLKSVEAHWDFTNEWCRRDRRFQRFHDFVSAAVYGTLEFHAERFSYVYDLHYRNVLEYFHDRPGDLLVIDICRGQGWEALCPFLGVSVPGDNFPHANRKEDKDSRWNWMQQIDRASLELERMRDRDLQIALADDWQLVGSPLDDQIAGRFLEQDGQYCGPPADDAQAIAETERLGASGMNRLVLTWPVFSWLEHYPDWARYLHARCPMVWESEQIRVFNLQELTGGAVDSQTGRSVLANRS